MTSSDDTRERLAAYAHEAWSGWMKYLFSKAEIIHESSGGDTAHLNEDLVERWTRQMNTPYADLPEDEKKSDLEEADKMIALLDEELQTLITQNTALRKANETFSKSSRVRGKK